MTLPTFRSESDQEGSRKPRDSVTRDERSEVPNWTKFSESLSLFKMDNQFSSVAVLLVVICFFLLTAVPVSHVGGTWIQGQPKGQQHQLSGENEKVVPIGIPIFIHPEYPFDPIRNLKIQKSDEPSLPPKLEPESAKGQGQLLDFRSIETTTTTTTVQPLETNLLTADVDMKKEEEAVNVDGQTSTTTISSKMEPEQPNRRKFVLDPVIHEHLRNANDKLRLEGVDTSTQESVTKKRQIPSSTGVFSSVKYPVTSPRQYDYSDFFDMTKICRQYPTRVACRYFSKKYSWPLPDYVTSTTRLPPYRRPPWTVYQTPRPTEPHFVGRKYTPMLKELHRPTYGYY